MSYTKQMRVLKRQMKPTVSSKKNKLDSYTRWLNISYNSKIQERMDELRGDHAHLMTVKKDIRRIKKVCHCQNLHDVANKLEKDYINKSKIIDTNIPLTNQQAIILGCLASQSVRIDDPKANYEKIKNYIRSSIDNANASTQSTNQDSNSAIPVDQNGNVRNVNNVSKDSNQNNPDIYNATNNINDNK